MATTILGTGSYLPENIVSNDDLAKYMDTSDEWISSRTGIRFRHISNKETAAEIAYYAAASALKHSGILAENIDLIIAATITPDCLTPSMSCILQEKLGAVNAVCFDINAACSGFIFAMNTAHMYLQAGMARYALVLGVEVLSSILDWTDRSTCVLFGDGAGAAVLGPGEYGIQDFIMGSDGSHGKALLCSGRPLRNLYSNEEAANPYVHMDGQAVFRFAVRQVPECIEQLLKRSST